MDCRTFIVEILKALAWPITVLVVASAAWKHIVPLFPRVREVRYGDAQVSFSAELKEVAETAGDVVPPRGALPAAPATETERIARLLELSPRASVLEAFVPVQTALVALARASRTTVERGDRYSSTALADRLTDRGIMSQGQRDLFGTLRHLRNAAAHAPEFTEPPESVREYIDLAGRLAAALRLQAA